MTMHRDPSLNPNKENLLAEASSYNEIDEKQNRKSFIIDLPPEEFSSENGSDENIVPLTPHSRTSPVKKKSPKRFLDLLEYTRDDIEVSRHVHVLKCEERQRLAHESRMDYLRELKKKSFLEATRLLEARKRREEARRAVQEVTLKKQTRGIRRAEEARYQAMEKAQKSHSRIEEVRFVNETKKMEKQLLISKKMSEVEHNLEQRREEQKRQATEKNDALKAAAERRMKIKNEQMKQQLIRAQKREETEKRIQELKEIDLKVKHQKSEEWERKIQKHQILSEAETTALKQRSKEKFEQSEVLLQERREHILRKVEMQKQKLKEAKERRDREVEYNYSYLDIMASYDTEEEEVLSQKLQSALDASQKQSKSFNESYQKSCSIPIREFQKSKLKVTLGRLASSTTSGDPMQCRLLLAEIRAGNLSHIDHEYIRYSNSLDTLTKIIICCRKTRHVAIVKQAVDTLTSLFVAANEGPHHASYFVRSGLIIQIIIAAHEEANTMRKNSLTVTLSSLLNCVATCLECLSAAGETNDRFMSVRDSLISDAERLALDRIYFVVFKMCLAPKDLELSYIGLRITSVILLFYAKKKGESKGLWRYCLAVSLFAMLQNIVGGGAGNPDIQRGASSQSRFTNSQISLIFCGLRQLNILAQWKISDFQEMLHDSTSHTTVSSGNGSNITSDLPLPEVCVQITRMEMFHFLNQFFRYVRTHHDDLESIEVETNKIKDLGLNTRAEKNEFTLASLPIPPNNDIENMNHTCLSNASHLRAALHECILLLGYLCVDDSLLQDILSWRFKGKTLLENMLIALPVHYFTTAQNILFPTILAVVDNHPRNMSIVQNVMELQLVREFLEEEMQHISKKARQYAETRSATIKAYRDSCNIEEDVSNNSSNSALLSEGRGESLYSSSPPKNKKHDSGDYVAEGEKEKLFKNFKTDVTNYNAFFKLEKRVPVALWPLLLSQMSAVLVEK